MVNVALSQTARFPSKAVRAAGTFLVFCFPVVVTATSPDVEPRIALRLDLQDALRLADTRAPELAVALAERSGVSAIRQTADRRLHRPPTVEVTVGPRRPSGGGNLGVDASVGIYQEFSLGGYGKRLSEYADATQVRADSNFEVVRRDARVRAYLAWLDALQARELLKLRLDALKEIREVLRIAEARLAAGRSSPGEAALARALVGSAEASVLAARRDISQIDTLLRHVCGIEPHRPLEITSVLDTPSRVIDETTIKTQVLRVAPDLTAARARANALNHSVALGRAASRPFLEIGPTVTREGNGDWLFLGNVRMPLPGIDPAAVDNAERHLEAHVAASQVSVLEQAVLRDVELSLLEREHALTARELLLRESVVPSKLAAREALLQYEAGRSDLVNVITARRELYDALERWITAAIDVQRADARLERYLELDSQKKGRK